MTAVSLVRSIAPRRYNCQVHVRVPGNIPATLGLGSCKAKPEHADDMAAAPNRARLPATRMAALALGAAAVGALALGAVAVGRLAVGGLTVRRARFRSVEIEDLTVRRLRVIETMPKTTYRPDRIRAYADR